MRVSLRLNYATDHEKAVLLCPHCSSENTHPCRGQVVGQPSEDRRYRVRVLLECDDCNRQFVVGLARDGVRTLIGFDGKEVDEGQVEILTELDDPRND